MIATILTVAAIAMLVVTLDGRLERRRRARDLASFLRALEAGR